MGSAWTSYPWPADKNVWGLLDPPRHHSLVLIRVGLWYISWDDEWVIVQQLAVGCSHRSGISHTSRLRTPGRQAPGRSFEDIDKDAEVSLVDETQGRSNDAEMFDTDNLHGDEVIGIMAVGSWLKSKSYDEIQKLFDKEMKRVNTFVDMNSEVVKGSETRTEESSKRAGDELESDKSKKQKIDEHVEAEKDDDPEEEEMKKHMEIVQDEEEIAIDAIPLATKPPMIVEYKIVKEGQKGFYHLIRADGSSKRYSSMIRMLQGIDREDLETLWKLVKEKHGINRPVDEYERVLWGDLKVMFEPDIKSDVWRNLQGYKVTVWKLFDNCRVHFVRFRNLHIFMLVEKRYPLTPITISNMLNKKLQADRWNEMCYQLLKLMTKQEKGQ
ncbi:hypothetical protein Tco_1003461 [Tanacetum coccineum]|uniref:Uncharacterized protein n=1 Tax=Tanacetum coccineum TaxID=301880 RepID=A0ABQ5FAM3_9ASTR